MPAPSTAAAYDLLAERWQDAAFNPANGIGQHERALAFVDGAGEGWSAGGLDQAAEHVDAAMGPALYYATLGIPGLIALVYEAGCACRHLEFDQHPEQHLFVIAQRAA